MFWEERKTSQAVVLCYEPMWYAACFCTCSGVSNVAGLSPQSRLLYNDAMAFLKRFSSFSLKVFIDRGSKQSTTDLIIVFTITYALFWALKTHVWLLQLRMSFHLYAVDWCCLTKWPNPESSLFTQIFTAASTEPGIFVVKAACGACVSLRSPRFFSWWRF